MSIDIAKLRKLLADGPPGPWRLRPSQQSSAGYISVYANESDLITGQFTAYEGRGPAEADATLIVAAVNALPELLDEIEAITRKYHEAMDILAEWSNIDAADAVAQRQPARERIAQLEAEKKALMAATIDAGNAMNHKMAKLEAALRRVFDEQGWIWVRDVLESKEQVK